MYIIRDVDIVITYKTDFDTPHSMRDSLKTLLYKTITSEGNDSFFIQRRNTILSTTRDYFKQISVHLPLLFRDELLFIWSHIVCTSYLFVIILLHKVVVLVFVKYVL